jgi:hypothetical protein
MKKILFIVMISMFGLTFETCDKPSSDRVAREQQEKILKEGISQVGMPAIKNFREKRMMKMILELRDQENIILYAYIAAENTGQLHFIGKCIGYPIPYSTQYTNPQKPLWNGNGIATIAQADPNGLFSPASAEGTWLLMVSPKGDPKVVYIEPRIVVSPFPLN